MIHKTAEVEEGSKIGDNTKIWHFAHIRKEAKIGKNCVIAKGVFVDVGVKIGDNVKIGNNVSVFRGVEIEDGVQVAPHVCFTNDKLPRAINPGGSPKGAEDWVLGKTKVKKGASIGANSTILNDLTIGEFALIGAGSVVTKNVPDYGLVYGVPAKLMGYVCKCGNKLGNSNLKGLIKCKHCKSEILISPELFVKNIKSIYIKSQDLTK